MEIYLSSCSSLFRGWAIERFAWVWGIFFIFFQTESTVVFVFFFGVQRMAYVVLL